MSLSAVQPERLTISWTIAVRSGVRWAGPWAPTVVHGSGVHAAEASVVAREDTLKLTVVKALASSVSSPLISSDVAPVFTSLAWNWM